METLLSPSEIAKRLNCCENTARAMMRKMQHIILPGGTAHKMVRVSETAFRAWLMQNTVDPTPPHKGRKNAPTPFKCPADGLDERGRIKRRTV